MILQRSAVSPVVATMILIIIAVVAVGSFAYLLSSFQTQQQNHNAQVQSAKNQDLKISFLQLFPQQTTTTDITAILITVQNLDTAQAGLAGIEINGNYTAFGSIKNIAQSPFSVLTNGGYTPVNATQVISGKASLNVEANLSSSNFLFPIPRTIAVVIDLITTSQDIFPMILEPPVAQFGAQEIGISNELLNASRSYSVDTSIQSYSWNFEALNNSNVPPNLNPLSPLSGRNVQYFPTTSFTYVSLRVVDTYGLVNAISGIVNTQSQNLSVSGALTTSTVTVSTTSTTTGSGPPPSCNSPSQDAQLFVCPYLNQIERVREVLMSPYSPGTRQSYGYYAPLGITCGGNIEPSPAIGVGGGYNNVCVIIDNNLEGSKSLDYFNSAGSILSTVPGWAAVNTNIYGKVRADLALPWDGIGGCGAPFQVYTYPNSFGGFLDRREGEYGFNGPYFAQLVQPGIHLGGIGNNCGTQGQTWYLPGYENPGAITIVTEFPSEQSPGTNSNLEELSFVIDELYMQCIAGTSPCSQWQAAYRNAMAQYPFGAPRQALHFIQATRATQAWKLTNMTASGLSPLQMVEITIQQVFTSSSQTGPMGVGGATGPDGGLYQQWGGAGSSDTPEPNFQTMIAFDPNMPNWFTASCYAQAQITPGSC